MSYSPQLFRDAFVAAFKINRHFIKWNTSSQRTSHMISHIYRTIADYLDLSVEYEYKSIDAVFYSREAEEPNDTTIQIAVEHENDARRAHEEVQKLVTHNFPLSILVTYTWDGREGGSIVAPNFHQDWFARRFGPILSVKGDLNPFLLVPDETIARERKWYYYVYHDRLFDRLE